MRRSISSNSIRSARVPVAEPDLIERVAAAMWESREGAEPRTWDTADEWQDIYRKMASVAIKMVRRFEEDNARR